MSAEVWSCVVCCQQPIQSANKKSMYALGICDHIICYECSTRMRVLCKQNYCPICRQDMPQVVFTRKRQHELKFDELLRKCIYSNEFGIHFEDEECIDAYGRLLEHPCRKCKNRTPFRNLDNLRTHLRKEHELFMCDLCCDNLKIFTSERKYYTRKDLVRHRKSGDPEETCYRGHPLCHFCDTRYVDEDELHAHLRRDHFYCHFCDPVGLSHFYGDYDALREHFISDHFLCKECDGMQERFTCAFRSEIDLQAHIAQIHSQNMSKSDLKKARTLSLDIFIQHRSGQLPPNEANDRKKKNKETPRSRNHNTIDETEYTRESFLVDNISNAENVTPVQPPRPEDFPHLCANASNASSSEQSIITNAKPNSRNNHKQSSFSVCVSKNQKPITHNNDEEFPALPGMSGAAIVTKAPIFPKPKAFNRNGIQSHTLKVQINSSPQTSLENQSKITSTAIQSNNKSKPAKPQSKPQITSNDEFPSLPVKSKKKSNTKAAKNNYLVSNKHSPSNEKTLNDDDMHANWNNVSSKMNKCEMNGNKERKNANESDKTEHKSNSINEANVCEFPDFPVLKPTKSSAPPGLSGKAVKHAVSPKPPPGLMANRKSSISLSSVAQQMVAQENNNNCVQQSEHLYTNPSDFDKRNKSLVTQVEDVLGDHSKFCSFKSMSKEFLQGLISSAQYYQKCIELFGKNDFKHIFPELLGLLPNIAKQNELLCAHHNEIKSTKGAIPKRNVSQWVLSEDTAEFVVCPICQQVLVLKDGHEHIKSHSN